MANSIITALILNLHVALLSTTAGTFVGGIIFGLLLVNTIKMGKDSFELSAYTPNTKNLIEKLDRIKNHTTIGKFVSALSMGLGMLGTVCGIIIMFSGFGDITLGDQSSAISLLEAVSLGFGTALYTTLVGLASSIILSVQCFNIDFEIRRLKNEHKHKGNQVELTPLGEAIAEAMNSENLDDHGE
jgi:hypothetical protein